jgi:hypothetical protein
MKDANSLRVILLDVSQNRLGSLLKADLLSVIKRQRMKSVSELSKMAADLDVLMENVPMGTIIFSNVGLVDRLNKWMLAKLGYTSAEQVNVRSPRVASGVCPMSVGRCRLGCHRVSSRVTPADGARAGQTERRAC